MKISNNDIIYFVHKRFTCDFRKHDKIVTKME